MQLLIIVILASTLGFLYGFNSNGFIFSSNICLFAGITLIMPSLFKFKLKDSALIWSYKKVVLKGFLVNYLLFPILAIAIGLLTKDFGVAIGLFLISMLGGGGMVIHWINKSGGDVSFGFLLLFLNLLLISLALLMMHTYATLSAPYFGAEYNANMGIGNFAQAAIILLIVVPFFASRIIVFVEPLKNIIVKHNSLISKISIFIILFYLFGLQDAQVLIDVYDFEPEVIPIAFVAVLAFYIVSYFISTLIYDLKDTQQITAFWHSITRYLTLVLVVATFSINSVGASMLVPILFAYLVQIPLAIFMSRRVFN